MFLAARLLGARRLARVFVRFRHVGYAEAPLEQRPDNRGLLGRFTKPVTKSWPIKPVGWWFGLVFGAAIDQRSSS